MRHYYVLVYMKQYEDQNSSTIDSQRAIKEEYTAEGIDLFDFSMVDNSGVIELFECKLGLIASLNEECVRPQGKSSSFVYKIKMLHNESKSLLVDRLQNECEFGIRHFAGAVTYDASEFLKVS
jgi:myosin-5